MKCHYRNCQNELKGKQIKFCCRNHKVYESRYQKRKMFPKTIGRPKARWVFLGALTTEQIEELKMILGE